MCRCGYVVASNRHRFCLWKNRSGCDMDTPFRDGKLPDLRFINNSKFPSLDILQFGGQGGFRQ